MSDNLWSIIALVIFLIWFVVGAPNRSDRDHDRDNLTLVVTSTKLPIPAFGQHALYDGDDTIYLIDGVDGERPYSYNDQVTKYSLSSGAIEIIGRFVTGGWAGGGAAFHGQDLLQFGGYHGSSGYNSRISKFSTESKNSSTVNHLPQAAGSLAFAWDPQNAVAYIFGGRNGNPLSSILRYNASSNEIERIGQLLDAKAAAGATWDSRRGRAYIFGGTRPEWSDAYSYRDILIYEPGSGRVSKLDQLLPFQMRQLTAVYASVSDEVYLFPGGKKLIRFNPANYSVEIVPVNDWTEEVYQLAWVYVPKYDRIYIFGGRGVEELSEIQFRDQIAYIDLSTHVQNLQNWLRA